MVKYPWALARLARAKMPKEVIRVMIAVVLEAQSSIFDWRRRL